tara:strand:- start:2534 stop:2938 length:405 start_codon:yes stop_codon:yes gene_type:complete
MISQFIYCLIGFGIALAIMEMTRKGYFQFSGKKKLQNESIKTLIRQASRWSTAAKQDKNIMIAVLHANYGAGYLWALKDIATSEQIHEASGIDLIKFEEEIIKIQDEVNKRMFIECPSYGPPRSYLTQLAGESL